MAKPRKEENLALPPRCLWKGGTIYYNVPPGDEKYWAGRKVYPLGVTVEEATRVWKIHQSKKGTK